MSTVVTATKLTKRYGALAALEDVSFSLQENVIYGLLGRNGAGKTTLMQILTGQEIPDAGELTVFDGDPYENEAVLSNICFIKESQRYPDGFRVRQALHAARLLFPGWDEEFAQSLVRDFQLPLAQTVKKLSRGTQSSLGVIIGLASRSALTLFDEPYLGLDAVARRLFYDRLLADYAEHPRTIVLSTHLIDEVSELIEHVLLIDHGRIVLDEEAEALRGQVLTVTGPNAAIDELAIPDELHRERMGGMARATVRGTFGSSERSRAKALGLVLEPMSLQQIVVSITMPSGQPNPQPTDQRSAQPKETSR